MTDIEVAGIEVRTWQRLQVDRSCVKRCSGVCLNWRSSRLSATSAIHCSSS
ncbi:hypothetical protein ACLB1R_00665 [Escherichia coli]